MKVYLRILHGDGPVYCHTRVNAETEQFWQCAGAAIYRTNMCKRAEFTLPKDEKRVFATPIEFAQHHTQKKKLDPKIMPLNAPDEIDGPDYPDRYLETTPL